MILIFIISLIVMYVYLKYFILSYNTYKYILLISNLIEEYKKTHNYSISYERNLEYLRDIEKSVFEKTNLSVYNNIIISLNEDKYNNRIKYLETQHKKILKLIRI